MLIVVVIIGILAAAILPRINGYLAKTRDMKRQVDLRNIAAAVQMYKDQNGEFPKRQDNGEKNLLLKLGMSLKTADYEILRYGYAGGLASALKPYLSQIPKDPQKSAYIGLHSVYWRFRKGLDGHPMWKKEQELLMLSGEYHYQILPQKDNPERGVVLVAKVETPEAANYVMDYVRPYPYIWEHPEMIQACFSNPGWCGKSSAEEIGFNMLFLCEDIQKTKNKIIMATEKNRKCAYTSEDQLYYIVKIE